MVDAREFTCFEGILENKQVVSVNALEFGVAPFNLGLQVLVLEHLPKDPLESLVKLQVIFAVDRVLLLSQLGDQLVLWVTEVDLAELLQIREMMSLKIL